MSVTCNNHEPWVKDHAFIAALQLVTGISLIDPPRLWELWTLVRQTSCRKAHIIEVGVYNGGSLALLGLAVKHFGSHCRVSGFDTFNGCVLAGSHDSRYVGGEHAGDKSKAVELMLSSGIGDLVSIIPGQFPHICEGLDLDLISLAHIDVDTYQSARECTEFILPRLVVGGVIVFDDYGFLQCDGVTKYVDELWPAEDLTVIHNLNGHAIVVKTK